MSTPPNDSSKFGTAGYDPGASYNAPMDEPRQYALLKTLTVVSLGLYLISQLIGTIPLFGDDGRQAIEESIAATGQTATDEMLDGAVTISLAVVAVITAIALGIYLMVYFGLKSVKGWARILGTVFAIIGVVFTIGGYAMDTSMLGNAFGLTALVISLAWAAVSIYWLVLAFSAPVRDYMGQYRI